MLFRQVFRQNAFELLGDHSNSPIPPSKIYIYVHIYVYVYIRYIRVISPIFVVVKKWFE